MDGRSGPLLAFGRDRAVCGVLRDGLAPFHARVVRCSFPRMVQALTTGEPPSVVVADLAGDPRTAPDRVLAIRALLPPHCQLLAVPDVSDPDEFRACYHAGAADCLPRPLTPALVRESVAPFVSDPTLASDAHERAGRVVVLAGSNGLGLASLASRMCAALADRGDTVACVDFDPLASRISTLTGASHGPALDATLLAVETRLKLADNAGAAVPSIEVDPRLIVPTPFGYGIVGFPIPQSVPEDPPTPEAVRHVLDALTSHARVVLAVSIADPELRLAAMDAADTVLLAFEPTLTSLGFATHTLGALAEPVRAVLLQVHPRGPARLSQSDIVHAFAGRRPDAVLPFDPALAGDLAAQPGRRYLQALDLVCSAAVGLGSASGT